jgi:predicted Fe-S protein YdhL (DUF1289 family)
MTDTESRRRINRRRGQRQSMMMDTTVPSPCLSVCRFDGEPFCRGCYRNVDEIREWMIMNREQKLEVLENISLRRKQETGENTW